ncbi:MAG: HAMP domain-containing histidine kinase [Clostridia bacterium]|nr:HAMP domain-containing histidine kinase [Clostridia bacterium]
MRARLISFVVLVTFCASMLTIALGFLATRYAIYQEIAQEEMEAGHLLQDLEARSDLGLEEVLHIMSRDQIHSEPFSLEVMDQFPEEVRGALMTDGVCTVFSGTLAPVTYVLSYDHLVCITSNRGANMFLYALSRVLNMVLVSSIAFLLISLSGVHVFSKPLMNLTEATRRIGQGDFSVQVPEPANGEMQELVRSFNTMAKDLNQSSFLQKDFIASVAHEFRTPIATIRGYAQMLEMDGIDEEERKDSIQMIKQEADRLARLSDTMLRLSALEQQTAPQCMESFSLDEQVRQVIVRMQTAWQEKDIRFELDLQPVKIQSDQALLEQVWTNLIQNAIKFSPDSSTIYISTGLEKNAGYFEIRDEGIGMDEETQSHIFDRFYQADRSRSGEGVGLGLSLVRRILNLVKGQISVTSSPGKGSTFRVEIPETVQKKE